MSTATSIAKLIRMPTPPLSSHFCQFPSQKRIKIIVDNTAEPKTTGLPQVWPVSSKIPPATKPMAANTQEVLASFLVVSSPRCFEKAREPSGQTIPG
ncbi:MAG: hypothetical protein M8352_00535 [ANME-2 cluster archaeon]|nr:hypothetical protein [ANME-2 cluster archaeon]MDF1532536.1 hypothetical protein [ANME-2 cluster archaeon]